MKPGDIIEYETSRGKSLVKAEITHVSHGYDETFIDLFIIDQPPSRRTVRLSNITFLKVQGKAE